MRTIRLAFSLRAITYLMGFVSLVWLLAPVELVWLPGPSNAMLTKALLPLSFLLATALNSVATRLRLLKSGGLAAWFDTGSYAGLLLAAPSISAMNGSAVFSTELSIFFVALIVAKFAVLFAAVYSDINRGPATLEVRYTSGVSRGNPHRRRLLTCIFLIGFVFCFLLGLHAATKTCAQPDEPFYLLIAQSIIQDGDLDLNNNLEARQYAAYYAATLLPQRDVNDTGEYISRHGALFPLLLAPFYALFGRVGAMAFCCVAYAIFCTLVFSVCERETGSARAAFWTWVVALTATPGLTYSTQVYPESLACLLIMVLLTALLRNPKGRLRAAGAIAAVILPWLKARYALIGLPILGLWLLRLLSTRKMYARGELRFANRRLVASIFLAAGASLALALLFYRKVSFRFFGAMNLEDILHLEWSKCWYKLFALFLDYQYGLLIYSPVFLFALWGFVVLLKQGRPIAWASACGAIVYLLALSTLGWWFGGGCPPCRYLVCLLPFLLLNLSFGLRFCERIVGRSILVLVFAYTVLLSLTMVVCPFDRYMTAGAGNGALERLLGSARPSPELVPSFIRANAASYVWIAGFVAAVFVLSAFATKRARGPLSSDKSTDRFLVVDS